MSSSFKINGKNFVGGKSIVVTNGRVVIDGKDVTPSENKPITIEVTGNVEKLEVDVCSKVTVTGNAGSVKSSQGDIDVRGDVHGDVETKQGSVDIGGSVKGDVETMQGDIEVKGAISGKASTVMGDVSRR